MDNLFFDRLLLAEYKMLGRIGQGAFGEVLKAQHKATGAEVAIKRIYLRQPSKRGPPTNTREIDALRSISHPNVVRLLDVFGQASAKWLVLELCVTDLGRILQQAAQPLPETAIKAVMLQILAGVAACHAAGIMHRDLKPSNILVAADGTLKLADFGQARAHTQLQAQTMPALVQSGTSGPRGAEPDAFEPLTPGDASAGARVVGASSDAYRSPEHPDYTHAVATRWYRAPELLFGARQYGPPVDLWAMGCIFAELLGGVPLLAGESDLEQLGRVVRLMGSIDETEWPGATRLPDYHKVQFDPGPPTPLRRILPSASQPALDFLARFLRYNPEHRLTAAMALADNYFTTPPAPLSRVELLQALDLPATDDSAPGMPISGTARTHILIL